MIANSSSNPTMPPFSRAPIYTLLLAIIACGLWQAWRKRHTDSRYSLAILFYALVFMASQGMFIISNPRETWVLFWLPLGIALSKGLAEKR